MKARFLIVTLIFSSCTVLFPETFVRKPAHFNLEKLWFNIQLDYNKTASYLINTTQTDYNAKSNDEYSQQLVGFFTEKLRGNLFLKSDYKTADNKIIIPFLIDYDLSKENIELLKKATTLDYIILSKIVSINKVNNATNTQLAKLQYGQDVLAGSVVFLKVFDIKNNSILIEMRCQATITDVRNYNFNTNSYETDTRIATYMGNDQLLKRAFKKILKKIK